MAMNALAPYTQQFLPEGGAKNAMQTTFKDASVQKKVFAEFVGTFIIVFTVGLAKSAGNKDVGLADFAPTANGCIFMVMVYSLGQISHGHFNPAITLAYVLQKSMQVSEALLYWVFQFGAGALAGFATAALVPSEEVQLQPAEGLNFAVGGPLVEFIYTFMLCFVVLNVSVAKKTKNNHYFGVAIGFAIIAGGYGGGRVSGGSFNPAITLGVNFMGVSSGLLWLPIYILVQLLGAFFAVIAFHIVREDERDQGETEGFSPSKMAQKVMKHFDPQDCNEIFGSFLLSYTVGLNLLAEQKLGKDNPGGVWSIGACVMSMMYATGDVSGGLFNPGLTLAILGRYFGTGQDFAKDGLCDPKKDKKEGLKYLIAQMVGGALGALATFGTYFIFGAAGHWPPSTNVPPAKCILKNATTICTENDNIIQPFFAEMFGTLLFAYVFLCVATVQTPLAEYKPFAVGSCLIGIGYAFGPYSGGIVNPAVSIGYALCANLSLIYTPGPIIIILAELVGGILAACLFKFVTHADEYVPSNAASSA